MPGLQARSPQSRGMQDAADPWFSCTSVFLSPSLSPSLPLSLKNKVFKKKKCLFPSGKNITLCSLINGNSAIEKKCSFCFWLKITVLPQLQLEDGKTTARVICWVVEEYYNWKKTQLKSISRTDSWFVPMVGLILIWRHSWDPLNRASGPTPHLPSFSFSLSLTDCPFFSSFSAYLFVCWPNSNLKNC